MCARTRKRERVKWCFTPSQPVQLYQGERQTGRDRQTDRQRQTGRERERERESKLVFYTQSTSAVISRTNGDRQRQAQREIDRQTDRQRQAQREIDRQTDRQRHKPQSFVLMLLYSLYQYEDTTQASKMC